VDTATDAKIRGALKTALPGATKLIIAQRITSVMDADMTTAAWWDRAPMSS
jgi:ATP-binding cassette subfamily B multidrug efflux pump